MSRQQLIAIPRSQPGATYLALQGRLLPSAREFDILNQQTQSINVHIQRKSTLTDIADDIPQTKLCIVLANTNTIWPKVCEQLTITHIFGFQKKCCKKNGSNPFYRMFLHDVAYPFYWDTFNIGVQARPNMTVSMWTK